MGQGMLKRSVSNGANPSLLWDRFRGFAYSILSRFLNLERERHGCYSNIADTRHIRNHFDQSECRLSHPCNDLLPLTAAYSNNRCQVLSGIHKSKFINRFTSSENLLSNLSSVRLLALTAPLVIDKNVLIGFAASPEETECADGIIPLTKNQPVRQVSLRGLK